MRIGMILPTSFPPDIRVEKEARTLQREHTVMLLCPGDGIRPAKESYNDIQVHRVFTRAERAWNSFKLMAKRRSSGWYRAIDEFVLDTDPDVLHVHDLPLLATAQEVASRRKIPLVADLHENYPAMLEQGNRQPITRVASPGKLASRLAVSVEGWKEYEREAVGKSDKVIVVVDEAKRRLVQIGVPDERIHVVGNYAAREGSPFRGEPGASPAEVGSPFLVVYAGGFDPTRDLETVVAAVSQLSRRDFPGLDVRLVGGRGRDLSRLNKRAVALGVADRVRVSAWMPLAEVEELIARADVGLVPHVKSAHTDSTIPHKLFQYMWQGLPVVVSNCKPLERIVTETRCGLVYTSGQAAELATSLSQLYSERERGLAMGAAGHEAVNARYNWDAAGQVLLNVYRDLTANAA